MVIELSKYMLLRSIIAELVTYDVRMSSQTIIQSPQPMDCYASMSNTTFHSVHVLLNYLSMHSLVVIIEGKTSKPLFNINMCVSLLLFCVLYSVLYSAKIWRIKSKISGIAWALGFQKNITFVRMIHSLLHSITKLLWYDVSIIHTECNK